jgi:hypothetical protein
MIKTTNRKALTGRIYNLQWYKLESLPLHPWRGEFTLIVDGATRRPEKLSCTVFGENASRLRLIDPPPHQDHNQRGVAGRAAEIRRRADGEYV